MGVMTTNPTFVAINALSDQLRLSKRWLLREAKAGRIPSLVAGNQRRFNVEAVQQSLAARSAEGETS